MTTPPLGRGPSIRPRTGTAARSAAIALFALLVASCARTEPDADLADGIGTEPDTAATAPVTTGHAPSADASAVVHGIAVAPSSASLPATGTGAVFPVASPIDVRSEASKTSVRPNALTAIERMRAGRAPLAGTEPSIEDDGTASSAAETVTVAAFDWKIPDWLPPPPVPVDNPMSDAKVRLGRHLFHDRRLSADDTVACASCHEQAIGFTDGRPLAVGIHGSVASRNAMGLANVGYSPVLTWANPHMSSLERQSLVPLFGEEPLEMGMSGREIALFERLAADPDYAPMFADAFPERQGAVNLATITRALAAFQRTLISVGSPYDRYKYGGDADALDAAALRGEMLFFSETAECYHCHQGFNFTDTLQTSRSAYPEVAFHNTGLYDVDGRGAYPPGQQGLRELSGRDADMGRFRTPSLRNVAVTAPYFHDGSAATLDDVLDHYAAGGRTLDGPHAGIGRNNPLKDSLVKGFTLESGMRADLKAFLHSLTDEAFLNEPRFTDPWPDGHPARGRSNAAGETTSSTPLTDTDHPESTRP